MLKSKKGQAFLELLPALLVVMVVLTVSLYYFGAMREAAMREEAVRNITFAKINNVGTLTTPGNHLSASGSAPLILGPEAASAYVYKPIQPNTFIGANSRCFLVRPELASDSAASNSTEASFLNGININTYAIINRMAVGPATCR